MVQHIPRINKKFIRFESIEKQDLKTLLENPPATDFYDSKYYFEIIKQNFDECLTHLKDSDRFSTSFRFSKSFLKRVLLKTDCLDSSLQSAKDKGEKIPAFEDIFARMSIEERRQIIFWDYHKLPQQLPQLTIPFLEHLKTIKAPLIPGFSFSCLEDIAVWEWLKKENLIDLSKIDKTEILSSSFLNIKKIRINQIEQLLAFDNSITICQTTIILSASKGSYSNLDYLLKKNKDRDNPTQFTKSLFLEIVKSAINHATHWKYIPMKNTFEVLRSHGLEWGDDINAHDELAKKLFARNKKTLARELILNIGMPVSEEIKKLIENDLV